MEKIPLVETLAALRAELIEAVAMAEGEDIQFPVGSVELEFQFGVTREAHADGKLKFWVLELGTDGSYQAESIHKVVLKLNPPVGLDGREINIHRFVEDEGD